MDLPIHPPTATPAGLKFAVMGENKNMPRELFDSEGKPIEVPDDAELQALRDAANKTKELEGLLEDAKKDASPDWRSARQKMKELETEANEWKTKAEKAGVQVEPRPLAIDEIKRIASEEADQTYINRYRERRLNEFGDRKEAVARLFDKLSGGEKLDEAKVDELMGFAARAAGFEDPGAQARRAMSFGGGSAPNFSDAQPNGDFADSAKGKDIAGKLGLNIGNDKK